MRGEVDVSEGPIWMQLTMPVLTGACGVLAGQYTVRRTTKRDEEAHRLANRLAFLDPLARAGETLGWKLKTVEEKIRMNSSGSGGLGWMLDQFHRVKHPEGTAKDHAYWCNGEGFFAASTVFATAVYFAHATRARREYLNEGELVAHLDAVSDAFAHSRGIYHMVQESVGECVLEPSGRESTYRQFCERIYREEERPWFLGVLDYYREADKKSDGERAGIRRALSGLLVYLPTIARVDVRDPFETQEP
jgi:hypothetical protein